MCLFGVIAFRVNGRVAGSVRVLGALAEGFRQSGKCGGTQQDTALNGPEEPSTLGGKDPSRPRFQGLVHRFQKLPFIVSLAAGGDVFEQTQAAILFHGQFSYHS